MVSVASFSTGRGTPSNTKAGPAWLIPKNASPSTKVLHDDDETVSDCCLNRFVWIFELYWYDGDHSCQYVQEQEHGHRHGHGQDLECKKNLGFTMQRQKKIYELTIGTFEFSQLIVREMKVT